MLLSLVNFTIMNISPSIAMEAADDNRGSIIRYIKENHKELYEALNNYETNETPIIKNGVQEAYSRAFQKTSPRPVNSDDILYTAARSWATAMITGLCDRAESTMYNLVSKQAVTISSNFLDIPIDHIFSAQEEIFTCLLDSKKLKKLLIDGFKMEKSDLSIHGRFLSEDSFTSTICSRGLKAFININGFVNPLDFTSAKKIIKNIAQSFIEESLIGPKRTNFSLKTMKENTLVTVDMLLSKYLNADKETEDKNYEIMSRIVSPIFWDKGMKDSKLLMLAIIKPIAIKLGISSKELVKKEKIPSESNKTAIEKEVNDISEKVNKCKDAVVPSKCVHITQKNTFEWSPKNSKKPMPSFLLKADLFKLQEKEIHDKKYPSMSIPELLKAEAFIKNNHIEICRNLGEKYYINKNYRDALNYFKFAADNGDKFSQNYCGDLYLNLEKKYESVGQDYKQALEYYKLAAKQRDLNAMYACGFIYERGLGFWRSDDKEAFDYYSLAAKGGHIDAMYACGLFYENGKGVQKNPEEASKYYVQASDGGSKEAKDRLIKCKFSDPNAQYILGQAYENGDAVKKNPEEAVKCYIQAAIGGNKEALDCFKKLFIDGKRIPKNSDDKINYFKFAATQNYPGAKNSLGEIYYNDKQDYAEAFNCFEGAAKIGDSKAMYNCHLCYWHGKGVKASAIYAVGWYLRAAWNGQEDTNSIVRMPLKLCQDNISITIFCAFAFSIWGILYSVGLL